MPDDGGEQQRPGEQEIARLGRDLGLGPLRQVARAREPRPVAACGALLAVGAVIGGIIVVSVVAGTAHSAVAAGAAAAGFGGLAGLGALLWGLGTARSPVTYRLYWFSGGLAEFSPDAPEPRLLPWADVTAVTVTYRYDDEAATVLTGCTLQAGSGTGLAGLGRYRTGMLRGLITEAGRVLGPRLVPPLIEAYESGAAAAVGDVRVGQAGITTGAPGGQPIPWADIGEITISHAPSRDMLAPAEAVRIRAAPRHAGGRGKVVAVLNLSGVPNGIFLPHLVAHAAAGHGVPVSGLGGGQAGSGPPGPTLPGVPAGGPGSA
jgi:hypothetical protein